MREQRTLMIEIRRRWTHRRPGPRTLNAHGNIKIYTEKNSDELIKMKNLLLKLEAIWCKLQFFNGQYYLRAKF